jgi:hypothetical protein
MAFEVSMSRVENVTSCCVIYALRGVGHNNPHVKSNAIFFLIPIERRLEDSIVLKKYGFCPNEASLRSAIAVSMSRVSTLSYRYTLNQPITYRIRY